MYNEELKKRFIDQYTNNNSTKKLCETIFNSFESSEIEWGGDLCTKSTEELLPKINNLSGVRSRSQLMQLSILRDYVKWCILTNVDGACDGMLNINDVKMDSLKTQTVSRPKHLQKYLDSICSPEEKCTTDNIYRCFYWLAYAGMDEEDILNVKISDVDFKRMQVNYPRKYTVVPIYAEAVHAFKNCVELDSFLYNHPNYTKSVWKPRVEGDTLIRGLRSKINTKSIRVEMSRRSKRNIELGNTTMQLTYSRVWLSGLFYRMYERELDGEPVDFSDIVDEQMSTKVYSYRGRNTPNGKRKFLMREFEEDYRRWKLTWYSNKI